MPSRATAKKLFCGYIVCMIFFRLNSEAWIVTETAGIISFEIEYGLWVELQEKKNCQLRNVLQAQISEKELRVHVEGGLAHFSDLFRMKAEAAKADVFHVMHGMYRSPLERLFLWIGGFKPSEVIQVSHLRLYVQVLFSAMKSQLSEDYNFCRF